MVMFSVGFADAPSVHAFARLQHDRVVAGIEVRIRDAHLAAGIDVDAVRVRAGIGFDDDIAHHYVFAIQQMDHPKGGADHVNAFDQDVLAVHGPDKGRTQAQRGLAVVGFGDRLLLLQPVLDAGPHGASFRVIRLPHPRGVVGGERSAPGNGHVLKIASADERSGRETLGAFGAAGDQRVLGEIGVETQGRAGVDVQYDVAGELDRAGFIRARRKVDRASAALGAGLNGVADGFGRARAGIVFRAVGGDVANGSRLHGQGAGEQQQSIFHRQSPI